MLEKEISPTEILQLHIEERKVERLGARRLIQVFIFVRGKQSKGTGKTKELFF